MNDNQVKKQVIQKKKKPMKKRFLFRFTSLIMILITIKFSFELINLNILDLKNAIYIFSCLFLFEFLLLFVMNKRFKIVIKIPFFVLSLLLCGIMVFGVYNLNLASEVVKNIVNSEVNEEIFEVYVLNSENYETIKDLNKKTIGIYDSKDKVLEEAVKQLKKQVTFKNEKNYEDIKEVLDDCIDKKIDGIYLDSSMIDLVKEEYPELFDCLKSIGEIKFSSKSEMTKKKLDITKNPFLIYISGNDTYGSINMRTRSDVNILVAVNPKTHEILLVNTPRDYYVRLHSKKAMDKLTHAGIYGIEESVTTLEDLYATDIDFYIRLNFSSLIKIVNTLGNVTVDSKYAFSYDGHTFKKGKNTLNGAAALAFARCRKELPNGDVSRGENQEALLKGLIEKVTTPSVITKYASLLETLGKSISTDMSEENITSFAKFQLNDNPKWDIKVQNVRGSNAFKSTYSLGKAKSYVMDPDEASITEVKEKLNEILEED